MKAKTTFAIALAAALAAGCDSSPLDVNPTASVDSETAITTARAAELAVNGAYRSLQTDALYSREMTTYPELYGDNLQFTGTFTTDAEVAGRNITPSNVAILNFWRDAYAGINRTNNVIAALPQIQGMSDAQRGTLRGEAQFIRALHYFNLVRYFGGVPLVLEPSRAVTPASNVERNSAAEVYAQIEKDLVEAVPLLPAGRVNGRATAMAANALLARVYLEQRKDAQARDRATAVIASPHFRLVENYRDIFTVKNSQESIFELQYSVNNSNSQAFWYFPQTLGGRRGYAPTAALNSAYEAGDTRRAATIGVAGTALYGTKYFRIANGDDNVVVLRLADMYLTRAEANARLGADPAVVRADVDAVRQRAGLAPLATTVTAQSDLVDAILRERRLEFALEGHRFFDLRRNERATAVLNVPQNRLVFPIPQSERDVNPRLEQNPGY
jgi:starch-binding outer membrane protein, SusD/RagB family